MWRYTFNNYKSFTSSNNYVTPIPTWHDHQSFKGNQIHTLEGKQSSTPPTSLGKNGALEFGMWEQIGSGSCTFFFLASVSRTRVSFSLPPLTSLSFLSMFVLCLCQISW